MQQEGQPPAFASATIFLVGALIVSMAVWAAFTEVDEIARGEGRVIPATRTQIIQATEAGVVEEIAVKVGQIVRKGQLLVRLDDTTTSSSLGETEAKVRTLKARIARLELEHSGNLEAPYQCPEDVRAVSPPVCENEARLLAARRDNFSNTLSVLVQRRIQRENELGEAHANTASLEGSLEISHRELALIEPMAKRNLVAKTELIRVERSVNDFAGQLNVTRESIGRIEGAIEEARLQIKELSLKLQQEALSDKTEALAELSVLQETMRGDTGRVARTDIRSPVDGVVNTMQINTLGSFVQPGTVIAEVVPTSEELLVQARISPQDIAFVRAGQPALVKISAYDFSIYGGLDGEVVTVTPDSIVDKETGEAYFEAQVRTHSAQLERNGKQYSITPGMICTAEIITGRKTILRYLFKPINKVWHEAFTER